MLTGAVNALHSQYPGRFLTDVRTACADLWENNPFITPIDDLDPEAELINCSYPLINHANDRPYHCLHGFISFLNDRLRLRLELTEFKGDIYLSKVEKSWYSQVFELAGRDIPFWIVGAGGKHDVTIKWWSTERYQSVVDHFRGKIQFVQVGGKGHHHPRLEGVIDLRGETNLRQLIRLVYHSDGVLCGVTSLMHLAAAVECRKFRRYRPCVVVAGGREPAHWEAYPNHQFIHTNGTLPCALNGGCWKDRVSPLLDGDDRDSPDHLCTNVVGSLPRCMDMITPANVISRIEYYFQGGALSFLTPGQFRFGIRAGLKTRENPFDDQPLELWNAAAAFNAFVSQLPQDSPRFSGRGIVICGGGPKYFTPAWVCINMLRRLGCKLPIQLWHLGEIEMDSTMRRLVVPLGVECIDAQKLRKRIPVRRLGGWEMKPYAILNSSFAQILYMDADNMPVKDPTFLFDSPEFSKNGALFWPDFGQLDRTAVIWKNCGLERPDEPEFESGQMLVDKNRCWRSLRLALWFNEQSDFYYQHLHGDKETFHLAFSKLREPYALSPHPIHQLPGTMCQHDFSGRRIFQHRNSDKWNLLLHHRRVPDFSYEADCRNYIVELRSRWDGGVGMAGRKPKRPLSRIPIITACMISCPERANVREKTLRCLGESDWGEDPILQIDPGGEDDDRQLSQTKNALRVLKRALCRGGDFILFLEDDLVFNRHIRHNLEHWLPVRTRELTLGSIYNPGVRVKACDVARNAFIVAPESMFGSQAYLLSTIATQHVIQHWEDVEGMQDIRISRLAGKLGGPIYYHAPSLVQHVGKLSVWGGSFHQAGDFDSVWRSPPGNCGSKINRPRVSVT